MNTTNNVTKQQLIAAHNDLSLINPAIKAMVSINSLSIKGCDFPLNETRTFERLLKKFRDSNLEIIDTGNRLFEARPIDLINRSASRLLEIPKVIAAEKAAWKHKLHVIQFKREELNRKQFTLNEINKIVPEITQADIDAHKASLAALRQESEAITQFIGDAPQYRLELLKGTRLEQPEAA